MNIEERAKHILPRIEASRMGNIVRDTIKQVKYAKQDEYETNQEVYKPLIDKMEKEIEEISELREEYVKNKAIAYPQQQLAITDGDRKELPKNYVADLDKGFSDADIAIYEKYGFPLPSKVFENASSDGQYLANILKETGGLNSKLGAYKGSLSKKSNKKKNETKVDEILQEVSSIKKYRKRISKFDGVKEMMQDGKGMS